MRLKLVLPSTVLIDRNVERVSAESAYGAFTILPNHIDFATLLSSGLLSFRPKDGQEEFLAVDEGIFVKAGDQVLVSTSNAVYGRDLDKLRDLVETEFRSLDERERKARTASARLESDFVRHYLELQE
jgi:F-type H+-transporting ATPase subunit epsilon